MKKCSRCKETKDFSSFNKKKDRYRPECRSCQSAAKKAKFVQIEAKQENYRRALWRKYRLTIEQYDLMNKAQNNCCKSCGLPENSLNRYRTGILPLAVDHDHKTDKVRGLLCSRCNQALGLLKDDPNKIEALLKYLKASLVQRQNGSTLIE